MRAEQKLEKIKTIYDTHVLNRKGLTVSNHIRHNLLGAYIDMERTGKADKICLSTIERVITQLTKIEKVLGI